MNIRKAVIGDLVVIVDMLADDELGREREAPGAPLSSAYLEAFQEIDKDPHNDIYVGEISGRVMAMLQFTVLPSISFKGRARAQIESVRVATTDRGKGYGRTLFLWAIDESKRRNCHLLQLTTNTVRTDAIRFYERLGFNASHIGMKLTL